MTSYDEDSSVYSGHFELEIIIDRPIAEVWKQLLDVGSWVTTHDMQVVAGTPGAVGAINRVSPKGAKEMGLPPPHYHFTRVLKSVPERQFLMKAFSAPGGSYGGLELRSFDDARLLSLDAQKTKLTFNFYLEYKGEMIAKNPNALTADTSRDAMMKNLEILKRHLEGR